MIGCLLVAKEFVPIFFGAGYDKVIILICVILPIILFIGMSNILGTQYLLPTKRQKEFTISVICGAIINFILNMILIYRFNSIGASIATVAAEFVVTLVQLYFVRDLLKISEILGSLKNYFIATVVMAFITYTINTVFSLDGIVSISVQVVTGVIVYASMLLILKDEFVFYIRQRVLNILKKEKENYD